jgi:hypothetical protein
MAFSNIDDLNLGKLLQIMFLNGVSDQLSKEYPEWNMVKQLVSSNAGPREVRFSVLTGRGPSAIQYMNPGDNTASFPGAHQNAISEAVAKMKEIAATIQIESNLYQRAVKSPAKYAEPLALEMDAKETEYRRMVARDFYGEGLGILGEVASAATFDQSAETQVITLDHQDGSRGFVGWFELDEKVLVKQPGGSARSPSDGTAPANFDHYRIVNIVRNGTASSTITLKPYTAAGAVVTNMTTTNIADGDFIIKAGQPTAPNVSGITSSSDYALQTEAFVGLESLINDDGRLVHGLNLTGALAGTEYDVSGTLDVSHVHKAMDKVKRRVGKAAYNWKKLLISDEAAALIVESRATDRRFNSVKDADSGVETLKYTHFDSPLEFVTSEFVPFRRAFILPEGKIDGKKVLQFHMTELDAAPGGDANGFHLVSASGGGFTRNMAMYLQGFLQMICLHPAACLKIRGFDIA